MGKYELNWIGKAQCIKQSKEYKVTKNLVLDASRSKNIENTKNLIIEGDNLQVLHLLKKSYKNKVKCIYIDPPYNTGTNKIYKDKFREGGDEDKHSKWLSFMYPRLITARDLLTDDGVIFISIDDNEQADLKLLCDEIFGAENFVASICVKSRGGISNDKIISLNHNYLLFYTKNFNIIHKNRLDFGLQKQEKDFKKYNRDDNDGKGFYTLNPVTGPGGASKGNPYYNFLDVINYWRFSKDRMQKMYEQGLIIKKGNTLYQKTYKNNIENKVKKISTWWDSNNFSTSVGTSELKKLFNIQNANDFFSNPKPKELIKQILELCTAQNDIILDFFAGSGTTAQAVMELNQEDGGNRQFILVQLPEKIDEKKEAFKAGYTKISDITIERIKRASEKYPNVDNGFKVLKLSE